MLRDLDILNIDYSATNEDYRRTEYHQTKDLSGNYLIPFEGPMFARNLVVRADGAPLAIETDYTLADDFEELELMTGKKVIGCIKVSNRILNDYKEIKIVYQKVGEVIVSRQFLLESADKIINSETPVDWLTQVLGKPDTFPPAYHIHDVREKEELLGFSDLLLLFKQASGEIKQSGLDIWNGLKVIEEKAFQRLNDTNKELWNQIFNHIMNVTNPHRITKNDLALGNHPNYGTATFEEDQAAGYYTYPNSNLRGDVISTPHGVKSAIDNYEVDADGYVKQGSLPFSYYGSGFYLPPPIKGSFEGLGTDLGNGCGCLESNGILTVLARGYDSKVRSLYYYYRKNPYDYDGGLTFSGVKYDHPLVKADNALLLAEYKKSHNGSAEGYVPLEVDHVISGSSGLIVMVGDYEKKQYYIALGNGTLDYNSHALKRININDFIDDVEGQIFDPLRSSVMLIGDYVYIVAQSHKWPTTTPDSAKFSGNTNYRMRMFFRANKSDLSTSTGDDIKFEKIKITYTDVDGKVHQNADTLEFFPVTIGTTADGKKYCKRFLFDWDLVDPDFTQIFTTPYKCQWLFKEDPKDKTKAKIRMLHGIQFWYYGVRTVGTNYWVGIPMDFDTATNTLTIDKRFFTIRYNVATNVFTVPEGRDINEWYNQTGLNSFIANYDVNCAAWVDKLGMYSLGCHTNGLPYVNCINYFNNLANKGSGDQWELFNQNYVTPNYIGRNVPMESPFGFTSVPNYLNDVWYANGSARNTPIELFRALDTTGENRLFYRTAKDVDYIKRDNLKFPYIGKDIYARNPNANFGKCTVSGNNKSRLEQYLPSIHIVSPNTKDAKTTQYGLFRILDNVNNGTYPYVHNELYCMYNKNSNRQEMDASGGFYMDTLAIHTLDTENNALDIKPDVSGRLYINKAFWRGIISNLLGSNDAIAGANGIKGKGEYNLAVYMAQPLSNKNIPMSIAIITWHEVSATDPALSAAGRSAFMTFEWSAAGKTSDGATIPKLGACTFYSNDWGGNKDGGTLIYDRINRDSAGKWGYRNMTFNFPGVTPAVHVYAKDRNNYECFFSSGVQQSYVGGAGTPKVTLRIKEGVVTEAVISYDGTYTIGGTSKLKQAVYNIGLCNVVNGLTSGGSVLYAAHPDNKSYVLLEAVFVEGNWTLFIGTDLEVMFNGYVRTLKARNYSLDELGIDPANKTFYLYAVCGKTEGYYDLSLSQRTASPYHMLVATIVTISTGIKTIDIAQVFGISGFTISTKNKGGIVPATTGAFPDAGNLSAVVKEDLFDTTKYK